MKTGTVKLEVYVPKEHVAALIEALHDAGAGRLGLYDHVAAVSPVQGMFRPLAGSSPHTGTPGQMHMGEEMKLEMRCPKAALPKALAAIRRAHPYEEPVINVISLTEGFYELK